MEVRVVRDGSSKPKQVTFPRCQTCRFRLPSSLNLVIVDTVLFLTIPLKLTPKIVPFISVSFKIWRRQQVLVQNWQK